MKLEGYLNSIPVYSDTECPQDTVYMVNKDGLFTNYPKRKDGKPDMRYGINKLKATLEEYII